jgi:hypothetical protein
VLDTVPVNGSADLLGECLEALRESASLARLELVFRCDPPYATSRALVLYLTRRSPNLRELAIKGAVSALVLPELAGALHARATPIRTLELPDVSADAAGLLVLLGLLKDTGLPPLDELIVGTQLRDGYISLESPTWQAALRSYQASQHLLLHARCLAIRVDYDEEAELASGFRAVLAALADAIGHTGKTRVIYLEARTPESW